MTFLTRARQIVGLDIGSHSIKMVAVRPAKGDLPFELTHFGSADLPEDCIVDGSVVEPGAVARTISQLFEQHKVRARDVATSISGSAVIVRRVSMARMDADALREALPWEAEEYIPFDVDDVDLDFAILEQDAEQDTMDVVLVAARRERVDEFVGVIEGAKRRAVVMDIDSFALQNAFEYSYPERQFEDVAILNIGWSTINVAVMESGRPTFWRDIATGARQYVQALQRHFMLDALDAEEVLRRVSRAAAEETGAISGRGLADWAADDEQGAELKDAAADPRVAEVIGEVTGRLIQEIRKTFDFYESQSMRDRFDTLFVSGGGAHITELMRQLEDRTGWAVERFDPLRRIEVPEAGFDPEYVWESAPQAAVAVGLALREVME
jgi:type IV pilus assembly protein PilM